MQNLLLSAFQIIRKLSDSLGMDYEKPVLKLVIEEEKSPNELRAEVIQRAKEFVESVTERGKDATPPKEKEGHEYYRENFFNIDFHRKNNKVTALVYLTNYAGRRVSRNPRLVGRANCSPEDVFNEHIGKAIALGRAIEKDVSEFENAIQPTEPVIGHVVKGIEPAGFYRQDRKFTLTSKQGDSFYYAETKEYEPDESDDFIFDDQIGKIIDDTNAQYSSNTN